MEAPVNNTPENTDVETNSVAPDFRCSIPGRLLLGDLIGWDRVDELAAERIRTRRIASRLRAGTLTLKELLAQNKLTDEQSDLD